MYFIPSILIRFQIKNRLFLLLKCKCKNRRQFSQNKISEIYCIIFSIYSNARPSPEERAHPQRPLPLPALLPRPDRQKYLFFNSDIEDVRLRIRDHIAIESKRKGRRQELLTEDQYLELYFKAHSMDF